MHGEQNSTQSWSDKGKTDDSHLDTSVSEEKKKKTKNERKHISPQRPFITFSSDKICYCICSGEVTVLCCVDIVAPHTVRFIPKTKKSLDVHGYRSHSG